MTVTRTAADRLDNFASWFVRNPETGEVQLLESPNRRLKAVYALRGGRWLLHRLGLHKGVPLDRVVARATDLVLLTWALDEALRGRSPLRRTAGVVSVVWAVRSLRAQP